MILHNFQRLLYLFKLLLKLLFLDRKTRQTWICLHKNIFQFFERNNCNISFFQSILPKNARIGIHLCGLKLNVAKSFCFKIDEKHCGSVVISNYCADKI